MNDDDMMAYTNIDDDDKYVFEWIYWKLQLNTYAILLNLRNTALCPSFLLFLKY